MGIHDAVRSGFITDLVELGCVIGSAFTLFCHGFVPESVFLLFGFLAVTRVATSVDKITDQLKLFNDRAAAVEKDKEE